MYQLKEQEATYGGAIIYRSGVYGAVGSNARSVWLKVFICEIVEIAKEEAVKIYEDNQGAIGLVKSPRSTSAAST